MCTTELGSVAKLKPEFDRRNVKVLGLSVDAVDSHGRWADDIHETQGARLNFPLIADQDRSVPDLYVCPLETFQIAPAADRQGGQPLRLQSLADRWPCSSSSAALEVHAAGQTTSTTAMERRAKALSAAEMSRAAVTPLFDRAGTSAKA